MFAVLLHLNKNKFKTDITLATNTYLDVKQWWNIFITK